MKIMADPIFPEIVRKKKREEIGSRKHRSHRRIEHETLQVRTCHVQLPHFVCLHLCAIHSPAQIHDQPSPRQVDGRLAEPWPPFSQRMSINAILLGVKTGFDHHDIFPGGRGDRTLSTKFYDTLKPRSRTHQFLSCAVSHMLTDT